MDIQLQKYREVSLITVKRQHIDLNPESDDKYGHWWFEIGEPFSPSSLSFGWWPKVNPIGFYSTFAGVDGELNASSRNKTTVRDANSGVALRDLHHDDPADDIFKPLVLTDDQRTDDEVACCLIKFALNYTGKWQWVMGGGQNCHTFQLAALDHCKLFQPEEYLANVHPQKYSGR